MISATRKHPLLYHDTKSKFLGNIRRGKLNALAPRIKTRGFAGPLGQYVASPAQTVIISYSCLAKKRITAIPWISVAGLSWKLVGNQ